MEIKTTVSIDAAHRLTFHDGKCKNLHGHTWVIEVIIFKEIFKDMVVDFGLVKSSIKDMLDHKVWVYEQDDVLMQLTNHMERQIFPFETTAENIAVFLKMMIYKAFFEQKIQLVGKEPEKIGIQITVNETKENSATA